MELIKMRALFISSIVLLCLHCTLIVQLFKKRQRPRFMILHKGTVREGFHCCPIRACIMYAYAIRLNP
jgi:hypothetical protein